MGLTGERQELSRVLGLELGGGPGQGEVRGYLGSRA